MPPYQRDPVEPNLIDPPTLHLDHAGILWLDHNGERERLGFIEDADVPEGQEAELDRLRDDFRDSLGGGHEQAAYAAYEFAKGMR